MNIFDFAITKELEGETFYREMASHAPNGEIGHLFTLLADQERGHCAVLERLKHHSSDETLEIPAPVIEIKAIFETLIANNTFTSHDFSEADIYRFAFEAESQSLDLYQGLARDANSPQEKAIFSCLAQEEQIHQSIINGILHILQLTQTQNQGSP
jgi:rubrerythrin